MVNPISLVVLLTFLVIIILGLLTQYVCEYTQSSLILINYLSGSDDIFEHELVLDQSIAVDCTPKSIQLIHP